VEEVTDDAFLTLPSFTPPPGRTLSPKWSRRKTLIMTDDTAVTPSAGSDRSPKANKMKQNNRCSSLRMLQLAKSRVTDKSMLRMAFFADLLEIHLQWCSGITDTGIAALVTGCPRLEIIDLKSCSITDAAIGLIAKGSKELRSLDVSWCSNLTDSGIQRLSSRDPPPLSYERMASSLLAVRQTITEPAVTLTPQQSAALALAATPSSSSAPLLPSPSVHLHSEVTHSSEGPAEVSSLGTARTADVASSSRMIINGTNLHQNRINGDRSWYYGAGGVDDYESDEKTYPRKLENLVIVWCLQLTDASLVTLASLPKLRSVEATGCTSLSEAAVQTLRKQGVKVVN
jgi:Leucine Rich repeat